MMKKGERVASKKIGKFHITLIDPKFPETADGIIKIVHPGPVRPVDEKIAYAYYNGAAFRYNKLNTEADVIRLLEGWMGLRLRPGIPW